MGASSSSGNAPDSQEREENGHEENGNLNGSGIANGHQTYQPMNDYSQEFEFEGMWDNIDNM